MFRPTSKIKTVVSLLALLVEDQSSLCDTLTSVVLPSGRPSVHPSVHNFLYALLLWNYTSQRVHCGIIW